MLCNIDSVDSTGRDFGISATTYQNAFIYLDQLPWRVEIHFMATCKRNPRVDLDQILGCVKKCIFYFSVMDTAFADI